MCFVQCSRIRSGTALFVTLQSCRLETLNEARQGQVNRVKIAEKEREGLEGEKIAAEAYLFKDADRLGTQSKIFQRFMHDGQVCRTYCRRCFYQQRQTLVS